MSTSPDESERGLNKLLRRTDWRLLIMDRVFPVGSSIPGTLGAAVAVLSDSEQTDAFGTDHMSKVFVAQDGPKLLNVPGADALRYCDWAYIEWTKPLSRYVGLRAMARLSYKEEHCYVPWQGIETIQAWLPLGAREAHEYLFGRGQGGTSRLSRLARYLRFQAGAIAKSANMKGPTCSLFRNTARIGGQKCLKTWVCSRWPFWKLGDIPNDLVILMLAGGMRSINKTVLLVFTQGWAVPRIAIKVNRTPDVGPALSSEASILSQLHNRGRTLAGEIPRVLEVRNEGGKTYLVQTPLIGTSVEILLKTDNFRTTALDGAKWLAKLASYRDPASAPREALHEFMQCPREIEEYLSKEEYSDAKRIMATMASLPAVPEHRDFSPWNIVIQSNGRFGVFDWESAILEGVPGLDLTYFLTYLTLCLDQVDLSRPSLEMKRAYKRLLDKNSWQGEVRRECLSVYADQLKIDLETLERLSILAWAIHFRSELRHWAIDAIADPGSYKQQDSVFLTFLKEDLAHLRA